MFESCTAMAYNAGFASWGQCLSEPFFGDSVFLAIGLFAIFAFIGFKLNLPFEVSFVMGSFAVFVLALVFPSLYPLVAITVVAIVVYLIRGVMKPAKR